MFEQLPVRRLVRYTSSRPAAAARRASRVVAEPLERRTLMATQVIAAPGAPIREIQFFDSAAFQFRTDQTFIPQAGDGHVYQPTGSDPLSGVFIRTSDGKVYGNPAVISGAIPFAAAGQTPTTTLPDGRLTFQTIYRAGGDGQFNLVQDVTYQPNNAVSSNTRFIVNNTILNLSQTAPLNFDFFVVADVNPFGKGEFRPIPQAIVSFDDTNELPNLVLDPSDSQSDTVFNFFEDNDFFKINDKIAGGQDLANSISNLPAPVTDPRDNSLAIQWADESIDPGGDGFYSFASGIDPIGTGIPRDVDPSIDTVGPRATQLPSDPQTQGDQFVVKVRYTDDSITNPAIDPNLRGIDQETIGDDDLIQDVYVLGPGYDSRLLPDGGVTDIQFDSSNPNAEVVTVNYAFQRPGGFGTGVYEVFIDRNGVRDKIPNKTTPENHLAAPGTSAAGTSNKIGFFETGQRRLTVTREQGLDALETAILRDDSGLDITNLQIVTGQSSGSDSSIGTFVNPGGLYGLKSGRGVVVSTGDAGDFGSGPNLDETAYAYPGTPATPAQEALLDQLGLANSVNYRNVTQIDIDFNFTDTAGFNAATQNLFLDVVWGTENYPQPLDALDGFGVFLNGVNIARAGGAPVNAANPNVARVEGAELDGVIAVGGNPVLALSRSSGGQQVTLQPTGNKLTIIIADANDGTLASTAYIASLGAKPPLRGVSLDPQQSSVSAAAVAVQGDDDQDDNNDRRIVGGTNSGGQAVLQRVTDNGVDTSFGADGTAVVPNVGNGTVSAIRFDSAGRILVTGSAGGDIFVARFSANGQIDNTFGGGDGVATLEAGSPSDAGFGLAIDASDRHLVVGPRRSRRATSRAPPASWSPA